MAASNKSYHTSSSRRTSTSGTTVYGSTLVDDRDEKIGVAHGSPTQDQLDFQKTTGTSHGSSPTEEQLGFGKDIGTAHGSPTQDQLDFNEKHGIGIAVGSPSQSQLGAEEFSVRRPDAQQTRPPSGVHRPWMQVFAAFFLFMNSWGLINAFGEYQTYYKEVLLPTYSNSAISWIGSTRAFILLGSPILWGPLFDMGYLREVVLSGAFLVAIGEFTGSFCTTLAPLVVTQGVIVGLGSGAFFLSAIAIVPTYFPREKQGFAMGVAAAGSSLGGVVYPIVFSRLQPQIGFAWAVRTISLIALITSLIPCLCIRRRVRPLECRAIFDWTVFKDPKFNLWSVAFFFGSMGIYVPFFLIQQYAARVAGFEPATAFWTLIIMNAASTSGRILPGKVADKIDDPLRVIAVSTAASTVLAFCWIAIRAATPAVFVFSALYGFWSGAFVSLSTPATVSLAPSVEGIGTRLGMFNFIGSLGLLIGNPVAGAITEVSWLGMQLFCGIVSAVAFVLIAVTWLISRRK